METTMYEDGPFNRENLSQMKRKFTLDLNARTTKKMRAYAASASFNPLLTSPDLNMLKLGSPELDQMVIQQGNLLATGFSFPNPKVTSANTVSQEEFVKGFQETLEQFHHKDHGVTVTSVAASAPSAPLSAQQQQLQYTQLEVAPHQQQVPLTTYQDETSVCIKEEPLQTVPSGTPPMSPIDMENQEKIKLERKRLRNRIAASKCRRRKLERISRLEEKVSALKNENSELQSIVNRLRDQVCHLKQEVMEHVDAGCSIPFVTQQ